MLVPDVSVRHSEEEQEEQEERPWFFQGCPRFGGGRSFAFAVFWQSISWLEYYYEEVEELKS